MKENSSNKGVSKAFAGFFDILECLVYAIAIVVLVFIFLGRVSEVDGDSMYPTLKDGEFLFVTDPFYAYQPKNGDVVVVHNTKLDGYDQKDITDYSVPLVKRVIATENQTLSIDFNNAGKISINGEPYEDIGASYSIFKPYDIPATDEQIEAFFKASGFHSGAVENGVYTVTVPEGHVFVMGDNRMHSGDSRAFGFVHENYIVGKVAFRILPINRIGGVK